MEGWIKLHRNLVNWNDPPDSRPKIAHANPHNDSVCGNVIPKIDQKTANENITSQKPMLRPKYRQQIANKTPMKRKIPTQS